MPGGAALAMRQGSGRSGGEPPFQIGGEGAGMARRRVSGTARGRRGADGNAGEDDNAGGPARWPPVTGSGRPRMGRARSSGETMRCTKEREEAGRCGAGEVAMATGDGIDVQGWRGVGIEGGFVPDPDPIGREEGVVTGCGEGNRGCG